MSTEPLRVEFEVGVPPARAFDVWTRECGRWWPPTEDDVTFTAREGGTAVALEQRGWERLGPAGPPRRAKTDQSWRTLPALYARAC